MTRSMPHLFRLSIGTVLGAAALLWSGQLPRGSASLAGFVC